MSIHDDFYNLVGSQIGWDFSSLQVIDEGVKWEIYKEVSRYLTQNSFWLDLGTGGGERVLKLADKVQLLVGIDSSPEMIKTAHRNLEAKRLTNTRFWVMDNRHILFPDEFFDVISCRHSDFNANEVYRVLKAGGTFLTQEVSEADKINIKEYFGRGQSFNEIDGTLLRAYVKQLEEAGFGDISFEEYDATEYYQRREDIIFLLTHTPIIVDFGKRPGDLEKLDQFINSNQTTKGIKTNSKRFKVIARK